jgi:hypothetical protein
MTKPTCSSGLLVSQLLKVTCNRHPSGLRYNDPYTGGRGVKHRMSQPNEMQTLQS